MEQINWITQKELANKLCISLNHLKHFIKTEKVKSVKMYGRILVEDNPNIAPKKQLNPKRNKPENDFK